jgi:urate oxidase
MDSIVWLTPIAQSRPCNSLLSQASYGKSEVRLVKVSRRPDGHDLHDLTVDVKLDGDFEAAYVEGDNTGRSPPTRCDRAPMGELEVDGRPHDHAFQRGSGGDHIAIVLGDGGEPRIEATIDNLLVLKTTGSGWEGFLRVRYTSLVDTADRILATVITARWSDGRRDLEYGATWREVRRAILESFCDHYSPSVQRRTGSSRAPSSATKF